MKKKHIIYVLSYFNLMKIVYKVYMISCFNEFKLSINEINSKFLNFQIIAHLISLIMNARWRRYTRCRFTGFVYVVDRK